MSAIGDLILKIVADLDGFQTTVVKEAEKTGDKAGASLGKRLGSAAKSALGIGLKAGAAVAAAAFGIATKGALELENAVADFQSATGASAEESKAAGKVINRVAGEERTSLEAVTAAAISIRQNLGATGPEADKLLAKFVRFARVTKQEPVAAVAAFDDILDAWGITADHSGEIMDKLVVSNQKYGGSIAANQTALAALAPAMKAANLTIDDGIGLLNLFATSGVDAALAPVALQKALSKVKSPAELQRLIDDIIATEDPFLRAQKAADLFGTKAGAKLANVLRPGIGSLQDFQVATEDVAGATDKAAAVLDHTWSGRVQKAISEATAKLREFGTSAGPALTGLAALSTLIAPALGPLLSKGLGGAWKFAAKSALVRGLAVKAGSIAATAYLSALLTGDAVGDALSAGWTKAGKSRLVASASDKAGTLMGSRLGKAASVAFAAVAVVEVINTYNDIKASLDQQGADIGKSVGEQTRKATLAELQASRAAIQKGLEDLVKMKSVDLGLFSNDQIANLQAQGKLIDAAISATMTDADRATVTAAQHIDVATNAIGKSITAIGPDTHDLTRNVDKMQTSLAGNFLTIGTDATSMKRQVTTAMSLIATAAHNLGQKLLSEATLIINGYYDPIIAADDLRVQKDEVNANRIALADAKVVLSKTKAGTEERRQAQLTVDQSQLTLDQSLANLDQTRANLLATGQLSAKEQKTWLTELQTKYKTATGDAKKKIGDLITKIKELQAIKSVAISVAVGGLKTGTHVGGGGPQEFADGGVVQGPIGQPQWAIVHGGEKILTVPEARASMPRATSLASASAASAGGDTNITVALPVTARPSPFETADALRRLNDFGVLTVPR